MAEFSNLTTWRLGESPPSDLAQGLREIELAFPQRFSASAGSIDLQFRQDATLPRHWQAECRGREVLIHYSRPGEAFRALGLLMGQAIERQALSALQESCAMDSLGVMIDASRNGVPTLDTVRKLIRIFALLGIHWLMLYTEDTYEVPGEPLFGYFRGRYSAAELREIDRYAALFGMELVPCIQTLGHLGQLLRWPAYAGLRDTHDVLLADHDATYRLVDTMLEAASAPVRSRRIHIGMDEAHGIGAGRYRLQNGARTPFEILASHLVKVAASCERLGLEPMIWSDMYFRLGSKANQYYDRASSIPQDIADAIPHNVKLVYWDYYHLEESFYEEWIRRHRAFGQEPVFAAGIWSWSRFWTALPHTFATLDAGMRAACRAEVREAFVTIWGDDGMECDLLSILPGVARFADLAYGQGDSNSAGVSLRGAADICLDDWLQGSRLDWLPGSGEHRCTSGNYSKWLLWTDPILDFLGEHIPPDAMGYYEDLAGRLAPVANGEASSHRLAFPALVAETIAAKLLLRQQLAEAYSSRDQSQVLHLLDTTLPQFRAKLRNLWNYHHKLWRELYKPFGWEVIERRYGALLARTETLRTLLERMRDEPGCRIEEFEAKAAAVFEPGALKGECLTYSACSSPSVIF
ncbi:MAG TPA: hypothetical protein VHY22_00220 [Chthoniobacteraceae bacterium]|jgi:hypothetical protein|nr:hypothetical protein [Chthoniobacteraceae bacterium]